jgi:hypothetical protein
VGEPQGPEVGSGADSAGYGADTGTQVHNAPVPCCEPSRSCQLALERVVTMLRCQ